MHRALLARILSELDRGCVEDQPQKPTFCHWAHELSLTYLLSLLFDTAFPPYPIASGFQRAIFLPILEGRRIASVTRKR
jgi:hypothetical protein